MIHAVNRRIRQALSALIIIYASLGFVRVSAQSEPSVLPGGEAAVGAVEQLFAALVAAAKADELSARYDQLADIVAQTHDLEYIGQLTVRRQWRNWSQQQRDTFSNHFAQLSVMTYAVRFANVAEHSFNILGARSAGDTRLQVNTTISRADGSTVPLDFVLQQSDHSDWQIANVVADGVSDLALKRAEYRAVFDDDGFDGLIRELERQTRELASD